MYYPNLAEFKKLAKKGNVIPVYRVISADIETPVSCFLKIDDAKFSYLLESVEGGEKIARYSFLGSSPSLIFTSKGKQIEIITKPATSAKDGSASGGSDQPLDFARDGSRGGEPVEPRPATTRFTTKKDPLCEIKRIMQSYKFVPVKGLPRFCGGFVGYVGYDMVRFFEELPDKNPDDLGLPDSVFMLTDTILIFDHVDHQIKVVSNAHVEKGTSVERVYAQAVEKIDRLVEKLKGQASSLGCARDTRGRGQGKKKKIVVRSSVTQPEFERMVSDAKRYIRHGDVIQVVLSQRFETDLDGIKPFNIYRALRSVNPSPYMYYLNFNDFTVVGSSPEIMVRCEDGVVEVRPIAGTRPRGKGEREDSRLARQLLADPKERAEHIMLVDLGRNDIGRVCDYHTVKTPEVMAIERYSHVMHIVSDVSGRLRKGKDIYDVIRATVPAGTVTGAPKIRAMEIIDELENIKRGPYAGCVGYFSFSGNLDTCITIRTVIIKGNKAYIQAGAGIVADSRPANEFRETQNKAKALMCSIELAREF